MSDSTPVGAVESGALDPVSHGADPAPVVTPDVDDREPNLVIQPGATSFRQYGRDLIVHSYLIRLLGVRELKLRYRQTLLGPAWVVLQPLISAGILSFVFGNVAKLPTAGVPSFLFTYVSMLAWNAFSTSLTRSSSILVGNAPLVAKVFFPRLVLPISTVMGVVLDFGVTLVLVLVLAAVNGFPPTAALLLLPVWLAFVIMVSLGIGSIIGSLAVRYRDAIAVGGILTQMLLYVSPVAYAASSVPESIRWLYDLNPLVGLLEAFRWSVLGTPLPSIALLTYSCVAGFLLCIIGFATMERMEPSFADVI